MATTQQHMAMAGRYAQSLAEAVGLSDGERQALAEAGTLFDGAN